MGLRKKLFDSAFGRPAYIASPALLARSLHSMSPKNGGAGGKTSAASSSTTLTTLLEQTEANDTGPPSRKSRARSLDSIVSKMLADNFKGFRPTQTDGVVREGLTLRERLMRDKQAGNMTMGKIYYAARRAEYEDDESPATKLQANHPLQAIDDKHRRQLRRSAARASRHS